MRRNPRELEAIHTRLTRRAMLVGGLQLGFVGALALRMQHLQVDQADQFRLLAEENRINIRLIPPTRGRIYDRNGQIIGQNTQSYRIVMVREDAGDVDKVIAGVGALREFARILPRGSELIAAANVCNRKCKAALQQR